MADEEFTGPIGYVVFTFPDGADIGSGLLHVLERVDASALEVLDVEVLRADAFGTPIRTELSEVAAGDAAAAFDGVRSSILDEADRVQIAEQLHPGQFALAVVYEDRALAGTAHAWATAGGTELFVGGADIDEIDHVLEATDQLEDR